MKQHPEWLEEALEHAPKKSQQIIIRLKGGKPPLLGVKDPSTLMNKLDAAVVGSEIVFFPGR